MSSVDHADEGSFLRCLRSKGEVHRVVLLDLSPWSSVEQDEGEVKLKCEQRYMVA